jgi:dienelactone hydrolase
MGQVYRAKHLKLGRHVAIKVLPPEVASDPNRLRRFEHEARTASSLNHPAIVTIHDIGEHEGTTYIAMELVEGRTLRERMVEGPLPVSQAVAIAAQVAEGLAKAHAAGVTHPTSSQAMLTHDGRVKILDFGLAKSTAILEPEVTTMTRATADGVLLGTLHYMSPEQAAGGAVDHRSDQFSLGVVLYELLCGRRPFEGSSQATVISAILRDEPRSLSGLRPGLPKRIERIVRRCLEKDPEKRHASAQELHRELLRYQERSKVFRGRRVAAALLPAAVALAILAFILRFQAETNRRIWGAQQLAEIERLADAGEFAAAFALAHDVERVLPSDPTLANLWPKFSSVVPIGSDPPGARVHRRRIDAPEEEWELLGVTPLDDLRFIRGAGYRLRLDADGYRTVELLQTALYTELPALRDLQHLNPVKLDPEDVLPEDMLRVPGFQVGGISYGDYFMDRHEVTNREYKKFLEAGGYRNREYWIHRFLRNGIEITWDEAMLELKDQTGRPGPSTWQLGTYPEGQADHPVGGVSWYEAAAFARFAGKELPTNEHWQQAQRFVREDGWMNVPRSNFGGRHSRPVGANGAMNAFGIYDLVGNVREWCYNEAGSGRATRGGAWADGTFHAEWIIPRSPFERDPTHGFRLARTFDDEEKLALLRKPVSPTSVRDYRREKPVSDAEYEIFRRLYAYEPTRLNALVETSETFPHWIREKVAFDLPYGERGGAYLYLPKDAMRPLPSVIYWPGSFFADAKSIGDELEGHFDFLVKGGRAVALPIFKGALDRDPEGAITAWMTTATDISQLAYRDLLVQWVKDVSRTIDYLGTREDLDPEKIGYFGFSWGGFTAPIVLAVEPRIKVGVLNVGGFWNGEFLPEADAFHFAPRVRSPVLMINGEHDIVFPLETAQKPLFDLLGPAPADKRHYVSQASHIVPRNELIRETLDWLDRHLGPTH